MTLDLIILGVVVLVGIPLAWAAGIAEGRHR